MGRSVEAVTRVFVRKAVLLYRESDESATAVAPRLELAPETFRTPRRKTIEA